jgi:hypothetical protein
MWPQFSNIAVIIVCLAILYMLDKIYKGTKESLKELSDLEKEFHKHQLVQKGINAQLEKRIEVIAQHVMHTHEENVKGGKYDGK